jgi:predicted AlkP superfamily phosphohydrolase/phosphomutase
MPMTYPPESIQNGFMISGMGVPDIDVRFTYPEDLQNELLAHFDPDQLVEQPIALFKQDTYIDYLLRTVDDNLEITKYLLDKYPETDLLCTVFTSTDRVQHFYWQQMLDSSSPPVQGAAIESIYRRIDSALSDLMTSYPDHTFVIISDHGAGSYSHLVNINHWLQERGWLAWIDDQVEANAGSKPAWKSIYQSLGRNVSPSVRRRLKALIPGAVMARVRDQMKHWSPSIDWSVTSAYSASFGGNIYLNLNGREPHGIVSPGAEADSLKADIRAALMDLKDPEHGEKVVREVHYGEILYRGASLPAAPDLIVEWNDGYYSMAGFGDSGSEVFQGQLHWPDSDAIHSAEHHLYGILLAYGPGIERNARLDKADIIDIAPTLLHMLNLPIPSSMEGDVLVDLLEKGAFPDPLYEEVVDKDTGQEQLVYSEAEEEEIMRQLKNLGYLD